MIGVEIKDSRGQKYGAKVSEEGALNVVMHPHPPRDESIVTKPYRSYLMNSAGQSSMLVNGSVTNQTFSITADADKDLYIKVISFLIVDAGATPSEYGNLVALTNGCELKWSTADFGDVTIADQLKTNFDLLRLSLGNPAFGNSTTAMLINNVVGNSEAYFPVIDFSLIFGLQYGLRLRKNSTDKISYIIKDDVSTLDKHDAIAFGLLI